MLKSVAAWSLKRRNIMGQFLPKPKFTPQVHSRRPAPPPRRHGGTPPTRPSGPTEVEKKQKIIKDITIEVTTINNVINNIENNVKDIGALFQ